MNGVCARCRGSAIDPEDSYPGSITPGEEEPPALEPCRDCQFPGRAECGMSAGMGWWCLFTFTPGHSGSRAPRPMDLDQG